MPRMKLVTLMGALFTTAAWPAMASAQAALPPGTATGGQDEAAPDNTENAQGEIIVTATKRATSTRDVPATVSVLSSEALAVAGVKDLFQAAVLLPGTTFSRAPDDGLQLTIRGLGTPARTQSFDQSVGLFLDGAFLGKGRLYSNPFFDVERIEVVKGTQSTLLGKNTSLGAISIISVQPSFESEGFVSAGLEIENGGYFVEGAVNAPLSNTVAVRLAGRHGDFDGWVRNVTTGNDVPADRDTGLRATMLLQPSESFDLTASYQFSDARRLGNGYQFVDPQGLLSSGLGEGQLDGTKASFVSQGVDGESVHDTTSHIANLTGNLELGDHLVTSITSLASYTIDFADDFDFGNKDATYFLRQEDYEQFSQELRLTSPDTGAFSYILGVFYFWSDWQSAETQIYDTPLAIPPGTIFQGGFRNDFTQETETFSAFAASTYRLTDAFRVNAGIRWTDETKDATFGRTAIAPITFWNTAVNPPFAATPLTFSDDFFSGNISLQYDIAPTITAYMGYGRGQKTGGFAESSAVGSGNPALPSDAGGSAVGSETADAFEIGIKGAVGPARFELAAFYTEVRDFQETSFTGASFDTANVDVRSQGFEANTQIELATGFNLDLAATYADAEVTAPTNRPVAGAPKWTGRAGVNFDRPIGAGMELYGNAFYRYRGSMVHQRVLTFASEPWNTVDAAIGLRADDNSWDLRLAARNIFNDISADFSGPPADPTLAPSIRVDAPSPLRSVRIEGTMRF
jgi:iron complex outermembrane recepter protein